MYEQFFDIAKQYIVLKLYTEGVREGRILDEGGAVILIIIPSSINYCCRPSCNTGSSVRRRSNCKRLPTADGRSASDARLTRGGRTGSAFG